MTQPAWSIQPVGDWGREAIAHLIEESQADGIRFVNKLWRFHEDGSNRFDQPGEGLWFAHLGDQVVGLAGLNRDPYLSDPTVGRLRHLYVARHLRGQGLGQALLRTVVKAAQAHFATLTLRALDPAAARFYRRFGFHEDGSFDQSTHWLPLPSD